MEIIKMKRPEITDEMVLEAATQVASKISGGADPKTIAKHFNPYMDGYQLAKELDRNYYWDLTLEDVEVLDSMTSIVSGLLRTAEKEWAKTADLTPPLGIGTEIEEGVIKGIDEYSPARYLVKENGCTDDTRHLLIKFEDAVAV
jgi:methyl coenzyme M reductase subunit C-like uncharacterized protein (methanogenesis marker protein 7)